MPLNTLWQRESGLIASRSFESHLATSNFFVSKFSIETVLRKRDMNSNVDDLSYSSDGTCLVSTSKEEKCRLWKFDSEISNPPKISVLNVHYGFEDGINRARFLAQSNNRIILQFSNETVGYYEINEDGCHRNQLISENHRVGSFVPDNEDPNIFYTCGKVQDEAVFGLHDLRTNNAETYSLKDGTVQPFTIATYNELLAIGGLGSKVSLYDVRKPNQSLYLHDISQEHKVNALDFSCYQELLVNCDSEIYIIKETEEDTVTKMWKHPKYCPRLCDGNFFGPQNEHVICGTDCGWIYFWRKMDGKLVKVIDAGRYEVGCMALHPSATCFATGGKGGNIKLWNLHSSPGSFEVDEGWKEVRECCELCSIGARNRVAMRTNNEDRRGII